MKTIPLIIYQTEDGQIKIETHFEDETVWLNQKQIVSISYFSFFSINIIIKQN
jgi:hypothetical protein